MTESESALERAVVPAGFCRCLWESVGYVALHGWRKHAECGLGSHFGEPGGQLQSFRCPAHIPGTRARPSPGWKRPRSDALKSHPPKLCLHCWPVCGDVKTLGVKTSKAASERPPSMELENSAPAFKQA